MKNNRGAAFFGADQALIVVAAAGCVLDEHDPEDHGKLYVVRITGEDYDLRKAGVRAENYTRKVAMVMDGEELVELIRNMINLLVEAGEDGLIIRHILADMRTREGKSNGGATD